MNILEKHNITLDQFYSSAAQLEAMDQPTRESTTKAIADVLNDTYPTMREALWLTSQNIINPTHLLDVAPQTVKLCMAIVDHAFNNLPPIRHALVYDFNINGAGLEQLMDGLIVSTRVNNFPITREYLRMVAQLESLRRLDKFVLGLDGSSTSEIDLLMVLSYVWRTMHYRLHQTREILSFIHTVTAVPKELSLNITATSTPVTGMTEDQILLRQLAKDMELFNQRLTALETK